MLEFQEVFTIDLPSMPLGLYVDFCIDLEPNARSISIPLYQIDMAGLKRTQDSDAGFTTHLTRLTHKEVSFIWSDKCEESFQKLISFDHSTYPCI